MIVPLSPVYGTINPATEPTMMMREGSVAVADFARRGPTLQIISKSLMEGEREAHNWIRVKILCTLRLRTLMVEATGVGSNGPPQVAAAFAINISSFSPLLLR
jgi:hypothetical protein